MGRELLVRKKYGMILSNLVRYGVFMDKNRRFGGISRLYGDSVLESFATVRLCVVGIGGVGSWAVESFARSGIGYLTLIDQDHVAESNINRQLPAQQSTLGKSKIVVMGERIHEINSELNTHLIDDFLSVDNIDSYIQNDYDWVIDCIDNSKVKAALIAYCGRHKIPVITAGGAGGKRDPGYIQVSDLSRTEHDPLLAKTRRRLRQDYHFTDNPRRRFGIPAVWSSEQAVRLKDDACDQTGAGHLNCGGFGSSMPVTASFGLAAAAYVMNRLAIKRPGNSE